MAFNPANRDNAGEKEEIVLTEEVGEGGSKTRPGYARH